MKTTVIINKNELKEIISNVYREINKILLESIKEERGINDNVRSVSIKTMNELEKHVEELKSGNIVSIVADLNGMNVPMSFSIYEENDSGFMGGAYYRAKGVPPIFIGKVPIINGQIDRIAVTDTIWHELNHLLQQDSAGKPYKNDKAYRIAATNMYNQDVAKRVLARIVYLSDEHEQDSVASGLYGSIMDGIKNGILNIDKSKLEGYIQLNNIRFCKDFFYKQENKTDIDNAILDYQKSGWTFNKFSKALEYAEKMLIKKNRKSIEQMSRRYNIRIWSVC